MAANISALQDFTINFEKFEKIYVNHWFHFPKSFANSPIKSNTVWSAGRGKNMDYTNHGLESLLINRNIIISSGCKIADY